MIELLSEERCIGCNICVNVCPTEVFEEIPGSLPVIARVEDCQTCFMCEAYCPVDALYVAPEAERLTGVSEETVDQRNFWGGYRQQVFFGKRTAAVKMNGQISGT